MDSQGPGLAFSGAGLKPTVSPRQEASTVRRPDCYLGPAVEEEAAGDDSLSHHGDPEEEEEVIVVEEPER